MDKKYLFYGQKDLRGYSYRILIEDFTKRINTSTRINNLGGAVTFSISHGVIVIIENKVDINKKEITKEFEHFDNIIFMREKVVLPLKNKIVENINKVRSLKIILLDDLTAWMDILESQKIENHFKYGLTKNIDKNGTISLINLKSGAIKFHSFDKINNYKNNLNANTRIIPNSNIKMISDIIYDVPVYSPDSAKGFSIFQSNEEKESIKNWLDKFGGVKNIKNEEELNIYGNNKKDITINSENLPLPRKDHNFCHLCSIRFQEYITHIKGNTHKQNRVKNLNLFNKINNTFTTIREYWQNEKKSKVNDSVDLYDFQNKNINLMQIQNDFFSTNFESKLINSKSNNLLSNDTNDNMENKINIIVAGYQNENKENKNLENIHSTYTTTNYNINSHFNTQNNINKSTNLKLGTNKKRKSSDFKFFSEETVKSHLNRFGINNKALIFIKSRRERQSENMQKLQMSVSNLVDIQYTMKKTIQKNIK